ncbi:MAG: hypothetical protein CMI56_02300 [Parcubacteria group bacterium]|nr:hypothetical protein [Parcubacteria group bacterium]
MVYLCNMQGLHTNRIAALFPPPEFLAMPAAGIDISDTSIKYLDATYSPAGLVPRVFDVIRLPSGVVVEGVVQDRSKLSDALRELKEHHGRTFANVSLPEEHAYLYTIEVPTAHKQKDILQVVEFSLSEHAPIPSDNAVFNYDVIRQQGNVTEISVTVFPKDIVETYKQALEDSGFQVKSFELEDQSIARSIIPIGSKSVSMVIDFGRTRTGITIALGQIPIFSTTVKIGGNVLTEAIISQFDVTEEEADEIKRTQGIEDCQDETLKKILTDTTNALIDEIRRHYRYWDTRRDEEGNRIAGIERIFLCGGAVGLKGLPEQVSSVLQVPVQLGNVWGNMFDLNTHIPKISRTISWQAAASAGLLLRDVM